jgi:hypothetical protein
MSPGRYNDHSLVIRLQSFYRPQDLLYLVGEASFSCGESEGAKDVTLPLDTGSLHQGLKTPIEPNFEAFLTKSLSKVANRSALALEAR